MVKKFCDLLKLATIYTNAVVYTLYMNLLGVCKYNQQYAYMHFRLPYDL